MESCYIGDSGAISIANALKINKSVELLDLSDSIVSWSVVASHFAPMLELNTTLKELHLGRFENKVPLDEMAAGAVLKALEDYNDTANVCFQDVNHFDKVDYDSDDEPGEFQLMVNKIIDLGKENHEGTRIAPLKAPRNRKIIFNGLRLIWIQ